MSDRRNKPGYKSKPAHHIEQVDDTSPFQHPGESDDDYWTRFGFHHEDNSEDPEFKAIDSLPYEEKVDVGSPNYHREIERIRLSRRQIQRISDWQAVASKSKLNTGEILSIILTLFDSTKSPRQLPYRYPFLGEIYAGLDSESLVPDIEGIFTWAAVQGYKLFEPPCGIPTRKATIPSAERDMELQEAANKLARIWRKAGNKSISKNKIAKTLASSDDWCDMTSARIQRIIRKQW